MAATTKAQKLENSQKVPTTLKDAAEEVSQICAAGHLQAEEGNDVLQARLQSVGLHAYRYEELDDGSVVVLWANDADGTVKMKAFDDMAQASAWTPREE